MLEESFGLIPFESILSTVHVGKGSFAVRQYSSELPPISTPAAERGRLPARKGTII